MLKDMSVSVRLPASLVYRIDLEAVNKAHQFYDEKTRRLPVISRSDIILDALCAFLPLIALIFGVDFLLWWFKRKK